MKGKMGKMVGRDLPGDQGGRATQRVREEVGINNIKDVWK